MNSQLSRADQLEKRLITFAAAILSLSAKLPRTPQGRHISTQILRSGTAVAANYGQARGAESGQDFIHKLRVVFKELTETTIWLEVIAQRSMLPTEITAPIVAKNGDFVAFSPHPSNSAVLYGVMRTNEQGSVRSR